jgi:hypothetical protein
MKLVWQGRYRQLYTIHTDLDKYGRYLTWNVLGYIIVSLGGAYN